MARSPASPVLPKRGQTGRSVTPERHPTIALALGGGGARGLAHILMLEVLDELKLRPKIIAGTSIGAIFGAAYASGMSAREIRAHAELVLAQRLDLVRGVFGSRNEPIRRMFNLLQLRSALLNPETLLGFLMPSRLKRDFDDLVIPMRIVAADFFAQEQVILEKGPLHRAIAASIALPVLFAPVVTDERALMDGGLVNPLPFDVIAGEADITVAIDVSGAGRLPQDRKPPSAFEALVSSAQIMQHAIIREKLKSQQPDIYIDVDVDRFHVLEFHRLREVLAAGQAAKEALRRQLLRVLEAETLPALEAPAAEPPTATETKPPRRRLLRRLTRGKRKPRG